MTQPGCILIVDDEPLISAALGTFFSAHGYQPLLANDSTTAMEHAAQFGSSIEAAVIDLLLHDHADGIELIHRLHPHCPQATFLLVSGLPQDSVASAIEKLPQAELVSKPFTPWELLRRIRSTGARADDQ